MGKDVPQQAAAAVVPIEKDEDYLSLSPTPKVTFPNSRILIEWDEAVVTNSIIDGHFSGEDISDDDCSEKFEECIEGPIDAP